MLRSLKTIVRTENILSNSFFNFGVLKFNLPDLGQKIKQGTIKKLYVKQGDHVQQFQKLADVASDKQFTQITAADSGVIRKIHHFEQDICQVGQLFLEIDVEDSQQKEVNTLKQEESRAPKQKDVKGTTQYNSQSQVKSNGKLTLATPFVRGLIKMNNLNINQIQGSGPDGRITQSDVMSVVEGKRQPKRTPSILFGKKGRLQQKKEQSPVVKTSSGTQQSKKTPQAERAMFSTEESTQAKKMSLFQKGMQKSMTVANTIPHLYYHQEIDLTECEKLRKTLKENNKKVTVMGLLIKTFSMALKKYPKINATYQPDVSEFQYKIHHNHNISFAIDTANGLVVPNIKNVQTLTLLNIQSQIQRLKNLAVEARLTGNQLNNGTVCISNIGTIGGIMANPLILSPQVCIVAIGKLQTVSKYKDGHFIPRNVINVSFGCDHRIVDGATVSRFSNQWKALLQNPYIAMAQMI